KRTLISGFWVRAHWRMGMASLLLSLSQKSAYFYALTTNLTHESTGGGVQSTSCQHSVVSEAVSNGHTGDCDFVQNSRFQLPRPAGFLSPYIPPVGLDVMT